jgi:hypothetical protein
MTRFGKVFLRDRLDRKVHLAVFGKHPAWDDHVEDLGVATESLVIARRVLYTEGIGAQLASGAWDKIEAAGKSVDFNHLFVWTRDQQSITGGLWASSDGKGRGRFPLAVCLHAGVTGWPAVKYYSGTIDRAGKEWLTMRSQTEFKEAHHRALADANVWPLPPSSRDLAFSFSQPVQDVERAIGMMTFLLEQMEQAFAAFQNGRGAHFRVPTVSPTLQDNLGFWADYLSRTSTLDLPILVVGRPQDSWIDLLLGEPNSDDLFCLRAGEKALPPVPPSDWRPRQSKHEDAARAYLRACCPAS